MTHHLRVPMTSAQLVMLQQLSVMRKELPEKIISGWLDQHLGSPCPTCMQARSISREAGWWDGESWHSAFQENLLLARCENSRCADWKKIEVLDAETLLALDIPIVDPPPPSDRDS